MTKLLAPCKGENCGTLDGRFHSRECFAEHDALYLAAPTAQPELSDEAIEAVAREFADVKDVRGAQGWCYHWTFTSQRMLTFARAVLALRGTTK